MNRYHIETYHFLRDHGKPVSERDAADLAAIRAPQPPSRAHVKRVLRPRPEIVPATPREPLPPCDQWEYFKRQMSQLGGTRTIAPAPTPSRPKGLVVHVVPAAREEFRSAPHVDYASKLATLEASHNRAMAKMVYPRSHRKMVEGDL